MGTELLQALICVSLLLFSSLILKGQNDTIQYPSPIFDTLYLGVNNQVKLVHSDSSQVINVENGFGYYLKEGFWNLVPHQIGQCTVSYKLANNKTRNREFIVQQIPKPKLYLLGGAGHGPMKPEDIKGIFAFAPDWFAYDVIYEIESFYIDITDDNRVYLKSFYNTRGIFYNEILSILKDEELLRGRLHFKEIKFRYPNNEIGFIEEWVIDLY